MSEINFRKPLSLVRGNDKESGDYFVALCDDGSLWACQLDNTGWSPYMPVPGTEAAVKWNSRRITAATTAEVK